MEKDLGNYRKSYNKGQLLIKDVPDNPIVLFKTWFNDVDSHFPEEETNAMTKIHTRRLYILYKLRK